jgi:hypothetical protein
MKPFTPCTITPTQSEAVNIRANNRAKQLARLEANALKTFTGVDAYLVRLHYAFENEFWPFLNQLDAAGIHYAAGLECYPHVSLGSFIVFTKGARVWAMEFAINNEYHGTSWPPKQGQPCYQWAKWKYTTQQTPYPWPLSGFIDEISQRFDVSITQGACDEQ